MIRLLRVGRGPLASDLIYLCKYFQIFRYFISYSTKFASSCCCNTMFLYVLHFSTIYISLQFTFLYNLHFSMFYVLRFMFLFDLCFSMFYVFPSFICFSMFPLPLSISLHLTLLYPFFYVTSPSPIYYFKSFTLHPPPFCPASANL
jgi:hypothetical protein